MHEAHMLVDNLLSMWWIAIAAVLAPILALTTRRLVPDVVWLLVFGIVIGPHALGLADSTEAGFSFLIPVFFVTSGMTIDLAAVFAQWPLLVGFVTVIALVRGLPVFLREQLTSTHSELETARERAALGFYSATGLPIIVAVTQIAASSGLISTTMASTMVTGGAVTVFVFPFIASRLTSRPAT